MRKEIAQPCCGPSAMALRMRISSVPCGRSMRSPAMPVQKNIIIALVEVQEEEGKRGRGAKFLPECRPCFFHERYYREDMPQTQQREVSPSIIRAWFDTVLNPLIYGLREEAGVLSRGDLTWRFRSRSPVSLVPVRSHIMDAFQDNLEQFLSLHPECANPMQEHDAQLQLLMESCRELESALIDSKAMQTLFQRRTTPQALGGREAAQVFGAILTEDWLKVVAEYVINGVNHLPDYYTTADFWNAYGDEFLKLRESPEIRPAWETASTATKRFSKEIDRLMDLLKRVRNDLSLSAGVPIVENFAR